MAVDRPGDAADIARWILPLPASRWQRFVQGMRSPLHGMVFLRQHPRLIRYAIWPFLINVLITVFLIALFIGMVYALFAVAHPWFSSSQSTIGWIFWLIVEIIAFALLLIACGVVTVIVWHLANGILCGYFHGKLAEQVEVTLGADLEEFQSLTFGDEVAGTLFNVILLVVGNLGSSALNAIPLVGSLAAGALSVYITGSVLAMDYLSYPLGMRGVRRWDQLAYVRRHGSVSLGLGLAVFLSQLIPIFGAAMLVSATVGSVLLYRRIECSQA